MVSIVESRNDGYIADFATQTGYQWSYSYTWEFADEPMCITNYYEITCTGPVGDTYTIASDGSTSGTSTACSLFTYTTEMNGAITVNQDLFDQVSHEGFYTFAIESRFIINAVLDIKSNMKTVTKTRTLKADCTTADNTPVVDTLSSFVTSSPYSIKIM